MSTSQTPQQPTAIHNPRTGQRLTFFEEGPERLRVESVQPTRRPNASRFISTPSRPAGPKSSPARWSSKSKASSGGSPRRRSVDW